MIKDIFIIKDGIPLLTDHCPETNGFADNKDNEIMISGFFSALDSLSDQFKNFGTINELKLSNDLKLSFMRDPRIDNLIYIASTDTKNKEYPVKKILKKISNSFSNKYNSRMLEKWSGKRSEFKEFRQELAKIYKENEDIEDTQIVKEKQVVETNEIVEDNQLAVDSNSSQSHKYSSAKPLLRIKSNIDIKQFLTGKKALNIVKEINGNSSISDISEKLQYEEKDVFNICKNLMKMGLITFCM